MIPFARAEAIAAVLAVWIVLRLATRRSVIHLWPAALLVLGAATAVADAAALADPSGLPYALRGADSALLLFALLLFAEGSRRVAGFVRTPRRAAVMATLTAAAAGFAFALLPTPREVVSLGIIGAAFALYGAIPLLRAPHHRAGSIVMVIAVLVFAAGRTAVLGAYASGQPWPQTQLAAGLAGIVMYGIALTVYAVESARVPVGSAPGAA